MKRLFSGHPFTRIAPWLPFERFRAAELVSDAPLIFQALIIEITFTETQPNRRY